MANGTTALSQICKLYLLTAPKGKIETNTEVGEGFVRNKK